MDTALSLPLNKYTVFTSTDVDEVVDTMARAYCPHHLWLDDSRSAIHARHHRFSLHSMSANYLQYGADVRIDPGAFEDFYMLEIPLTGTVELDYDGQQLLNRPGLAAIIAPGKRLRSRWSVDCGEIMFKISRHALEACLRERIGTSLKQPLEFSPLIDLTSSGGRAVLQYARYLLQQADEDGSALSPAGTATACETMLYSLMLTALPHNYSDTVAAQASPAVPGYVAKAKRFIGENLQDDIGITAIAAAAGVTERTLYEGFRRFVGTTPLTYIRDRRLDGVNAAMQTSRTSVTEIAQAWGFTHMGRFARDYGARFGEKPSATRRRR